MTGAWEIEPRVLVVVLTRETTSTGWAFAFKRLIVPGEYVPLSGMPFDHARNTGCMRAINEGYDYVFFLDDDVFPPPDAILKLMARNLPIVSGVYYRRHAPVVPVMLKDNPDGQSNRWITEFRIGELLDVDLVGAGCLLIKCDLLRSLPPINAAHHWFEWRVHRSDLPPFERSSEDFSFCRHAIANGHKVYVDTTVICEHAGYGVAGLNGEFKPMELV